MNAPLVTVAELAAHPGWKVFDCRHDLRDPEHGRTAYASGHVPGAHFLHLDDDLSGPRSGRNGRHPLPDPADLARKLSAFGVDELTPVVAYDNHGGMFASRLWWLLRWMGHANVSVLDGGLAAWLRDGQQLEATVPTVRPSEFKPRLRELAIDSVAVLAVVNQEAGRCADLIMDARSPDRFRGENETLDPVGGHIPGAINRFFMYNLDVNGCFKASGELRAEYLALLNGCPPEQVIHQCGSGVTACVNLLAMEHAGLPGSLLYPGSWSEWCSDASRPVATQ